ncbi:MAG: hypothetical protein K6G10_00030 [Butyrivibrio sp.]|nr:hypothetical protein [Butyrivibrio sp.]
MLAGLVTAAMLVTSIPVSALAATQENVDDAALLTSRQGDYAVEETSLEASEEASQELSTEEENFDLVQVKDADGYTIELKLVRNDEPIPEGVKSITDGSGTFSRILAVTISDK